MPTKPDFTIADVLAWARTKPADERYCYVDPGNCALCHFLRDTGRAVEPAVVPGRWRDGDKRFSYDEALLEDVLQDQHNSPQDWTFGGIVTRLERLAPETAIRKSDWSRLDAYLTDIETVSA